MASGKEYIAAAVFMAPRRKGETKIVLPSQRSQETDQWNGCCSVKDVISSPYLLLLKQKRFLHWGWGGERRDAGGVEGCLWANAHAPCGRTLAVLFVSSCGFDTDLLENW